ncbi:MAG TPA: hypothetical protein VF416_08080 [Marmoricola sp.]
MRSPYTPNLGGYALGILVSGVVALLPAIALGPFFIVYGGFYLVVGGIPIGVVGAVLTHLACRDAPSQAAHVVVAGLSGCVLTLVPLAVFDSGDTWLVLGLPVFVGAVAAAGRASVIRLVPARQAQRAAR